MNDKLRVFFFLVNVLNSSLLKYPSPKKKKKKFVEVYFCSFHRLIKNLAWIFNCIYNAIFI